MEDNEKQKLKQEMLKKVDKRKIKKLLGMCYNIQDNQINGLDTLLELWAEKKCELYKLLGNNLKIERELELDLKDINIDDEEIKGFRNNSWNEFQNELKQISPVIFKAFDNEFYRGEIVYTLPYINYTSLRHTYAVREIFGGETKIAFSTIMHNFFKSEEVDIAVSKLLQKCTDKIKGKLYVSIDPFDYITMSVNKSNWNSCHSLHENPEYDGTDFGCYSAGVFSYMTDDVSLIAYKTDGEQYKYSFNNRSFFAESKNWRQMIFMSKDRKYFIASRQYPYATELISKFIREMIEERINLNEATEIKWSVSRRCEDNKQFIENYLYDKSEIDVCNQECEDYVDVEILHYNDMLHGFNYAMIYNNKYNKNSLGKIYIGNNPICPICGVNILARHAIPMCCNCNNEMWKNCDSDEDD